MTENKRFTVPLKYSLSHSKIQCDGKPLTNDELVRILNTNDGAFLENFNLKKENKELKYKYDEQSNEKMGLEESIEKLLKENKELKHHIKKLEKELHLAHMRAMFSTVKSFKGDVSKRYYYSEETDTLYDSANHYGQYDKILDKKEIAMLLNEYETMLNGDFE